MISVEIRAPDLAMHRPHSDALARRAAANVFMHPAALCAAAAAGFAQIHVLLAWEGDARRASSSASGRCASGASRRFCPRSCRPALRVRVRREPGDRSGLVDAVMPAFFDAIANDAHAAEGDRAQAARRRRRDVSRR